MKCARCSNELPDSSTFCPQCGFNQQQSVNYTAPERYADPGWERPPTFSYLPAGAPPWPTSVPQHIPGIVAPVPQSQATPSLRPKVESKPRRRTVGGVISVIAVLVLAPIVGILIAFATMGRPASPATVPANSNTSNNTSQQPSTATTTPAPAGNQQGKPLPTPTSFKIAKDANVNVSLQYPGDWTQGSPRQTTNATSLNIASQDQIGISFFITHFNDSASSSITNADQLNQSNIEQLTQFQDVHNIQNVQATNSQPSIAGAKWSEKDATFFDGTNTKTRFATISVQHGKSYYVIYFFIPDSIYTEAMQKYITPMLNSVKFLS